MKTLTRLVDGNKWLLDIRDMDWRIAGEGTRGVEGGN